MNDTEILNELISMLQMNTHIDWEKDDPADEFNRLLNFIQFERCSQEHK